MINNPLQSRSPYPIRSRPSINSSTQPQPTATFRRDNSHFFIQEVESLKAEIVALRQQHKSELNAMQAKIDELCYASSCNPISTNPSPVNDAPHQQHAQPEPHPSPTPNLKKKRRKRRKRTRPRPSPLPAKNRKDADFASAILSLDSRVNGCERLPELNYHRLINYPLSILPTSHAPSFPFRALIPPGKRLGIVPLMDIEFILIH